MKEGNEETLSEWINVKDHFLKHYDSIYERIGLTFDDRLFDSSYSEEIEETYNRLLQKNLLVIEEDGKVKINVAFNGTENIFINREINSIVYKLNRAVCGASHRKKKYNFDTVYYVAPTSEANFFSTVFSLIKELEHDLYNSLHHVKLKNITSFDKKLKNVHAEDIIEQAKTYTKDMLKRDLYLQDDEISEEMAEILSLSSLIINDMTHKRSFDYKFDWKQILNLGERSGAGLQFCHAGLKGLQKDSDFYYKVEIDTSPLLEKEAQHLIKHLSRFDEIVYQSYQTLEPHIILEYLFSFEVYC
ncbi:arginine--tRNA ligase, cytoplasmic [Caerostris extrusa]|uniref:Probable arginine--tRNA ligase, mitochondrial n=1 Tax=Caerostris extrusa TaxID=172846 RepID=A0AAV4RVQ0_CAEEX|nr:arginine--tRNA ligase, cytoplasmic [Caerostris extrusa]